ncbi:MAG: WYL domain-containing protein [Muribaculaceae bacterium]|nr:WYL domain-containing protein [Muribaculaceae bacterium]
MSYNFQQNLVGKYVWLIETIYRAKRISFKDITKRWQANVEMSGGVDLPLRTFNNWRDAIRDMFGLCIENERCCGYRYYIENEEDLTNNGLRSWIYSTYCVGNALAGSQGIKDRILLEYVPSGQQHLQTIIDAMKENQVLNITYYSYWKEYEYNFNVLPYCVKLYRQRWYMVALSEEYDEPRIYSLDRIRQLSVTDDTFKMPRNWSAEQYFDGCFGIIADQDINKQTVKLKVSADQAKYFRDLPLHQSQEEVECNDDYSIFTYYLRPTFDFQQEILHNGEAVEVLEPQWFRDETRERIKRMLDLYKED